jgi:hypothetical protein
VNESEDDFDGDMEEEAVIEMECPYCQGDGWNATADGIKVECGECGGTGWY